MKKILFLLTSFALTSCSVLFMSNAGSDISRERTYLEVEIFQTISETEALAFTENFKIVKLETTSETYYDGKEISGNFRLLDTYSYINKEGTRKTVPVYMRESEYRNLKN